jgi:hypothetical protein
MGKLRHFGKPDVRGFTTQKSLATSQILHLSRCHNLDSLAIQGPSFMCVDDLSMPEAYNWLTTDSIRRGALSIVLDSYIE